MTSILLEYKTLNQTLEEIQHFFIAKFPLIIIAIILLVIGYFAIKKLKKQPLITSIKNRKIHWPVIFW